MSDDLEAAAEQNPYRSPQSDSEATSVGRPRAKSGFTFRAIAALHWFAAGMTLGGAIAFMLTGSSIERDELLGLTAGCTWLAAGFLWRSGRRNMALAFDFAAILPLGTSWLFRT